MWGRKLRSQLDLVLPDAERRAQDAQDRQKQAHDAHSTDRHFNVNDTVYARNYGSGSKWVPGRVIALEGSVKCQVQLRDSRVIVRHVDQLCPRVCSGEVGTQVEEVSADLGSGNEMVPAEATH